MSFGAVITAAGHGLRMGAGIPKQYLDLNGLPVLAWTLLAFERHPLVGRIAVTVPPGDEDFCRTNIVDQYRIAKVSAIVPGGIDRQASVYAGLKRLADTELVAIHDGARPLVSEQVITATYQAAQASGAALACVRVNETVKKKSGQHLETIDRQHLWLAHTPQTFRTELIIRAHEQAAANKVSATDDSSLVELMGHAVEIVEDQYDNIKITTPRDLAIARMLIKALADPAMVGNHATSM